MANIPRAREILNDTLTKNMSLEVREGIEQALELMYRDYSLGRKAPTQSAPVTEKVRSLVKVYARTYPDMTQQQIAAEFNLNAGRVSEILRDIK